MQFRCCRLQSLDKFVDGCWEKDFAGIGAVIIDTASGQRVDSKGTVPPALIRKWRGMVGEHLKCQIELYVMVLLRWQLNDWLRNRRSVWWVDNDAARYCVIKGLSPSETMKNLVREFYAVDTTSPSFSWIERAPSSSNAADGPSRGQWQEVLELLGLPSVTDFEHPNELLRRLV